MEWVAMNRIALLPAAIVLGMLAGCVAPQPVAYAPRPVYAPVPPPPPAGPPDIVASYPPIPAPRFERVPPPPPPPPGRRAVVAWQPGHWHWSGYRYDWVPGRYVERVVGVTRWDPGHWQPGPGGYRWVPGHWV
jgi:hypothetical protein